MNSVQKPQKVRERKKFGDLCFRSSKLLQKFTCVSFEPSENLSSSTGARISELETCCIRMLAVTGRELKCRETAMNASKLFHRIGSGMNRGPCQVSGKNTIICSMLKIWRVKNNRFLSRINSWDTFLFVTPPIVKVCERKTLVEGSNLSYFIH